MDLSFALKVSGWDLPLANEATKKTAPAEVLEQVRMVMPRIINVGSIGKVPLFPNCTHHSPEPIFNIQFDEVDWVIR